MESPWMIDTFELTIRMLLAMVLGGIIGFEREHRDRAAGLRTHILVCIGSALIMLLSMYGFTDFVNESSVRMDPARLAAQVITGIGFLGAGVILFNGFSITGLTTAASLWVVAAIGLAIGAGFYYAAILSTLIVLFSLSILNKVEEISHRMKRKYILNIKVLSNPDIVDKIESILKLNDIKVESFRTVAKREKEKNEPIVSMTIKVRLTKKYSYMKLMGALQEMEEIEEISIE